MRPKIKFEIIASIIHIFIGVIIIYSLFRWRWEAEISVNSPEYELWWLILITATVIFCFNIIAFELIGKKLFPSESEIKVKKIPKYRKLSKICYFLLISGSLLMLISAVIISYILGIVSTKDLSTPFISTLGLILNILVFIGLGMLVAAVIMMMAGALKYIKDNENQK